MALIGRLHPLLIHFPIALVIVALAAEVAEAVTGDLRWRTVAVTNLRITAACAAIAVVAGWSLALDPAMEAGPLLEWHRWLGTAGAGAALVAAGVSGADRGSPYRLRLYRIGLIGAALLVIAAGHLGGLMVWGADFLHS